MKKGRDASASFILENVLETERAAQVSYYLKSGLKEKAGQFLLNFDLTTMTEQFKNIYIHYKGTINQTVTTLDAYCSIFSKL